MSLLNRLKKNSRIKKSSVLSESDIYNNKDVCQTDIPMMNVALSGSISGGLTSGLTILAGPSKHFKTSFALKLASAYLKKHEEAVILFYDSEFGSPQSYFEMFGIDVERVLHTPIMDVEELKFDLINQLNNLEENDKVVVVVDSIGNLASKKELEDALNEKSVADMTRAKALKGLFRMATPFLTTKNVPMIGINHTYDSMGLYPTKVVSGGTGLYYSASNIWIVGRRQNKDGTDVVGYDFVITVDKSRYLREKSQIPISVSFEGGVEKYSGLIDVALKSGHVVKPKQGWYAKVNMETGEVVSPNKRLKDTMTADFWDSILEDESFQKFVEDMYMLTGTGEGAEGLVEE
jgi:RecA/RadA recombinase